MTGQRLVLAVTDPSTGKLVPLRARNGRLLIKLAADPAATDVKAVATRARLPEDTTLGLMAVESTKREKLVDLEATDQILEVEIVGGLASVTGFTDHHARHENGGADEVNVAGLSGLLADDQTPLQHGIAAAARHSSAITAGKMLKADANGLPAEGTNTDTEVASAVTLKHSRQHALNATADHTMSATENDILTADASGLPKDSGKSVSTTVQNPGVDTLIPTEQAVREALEVGAVASVMAQSNALLWAFFLGGAA